MCPRLSILFTLIGSVVSIATADEPKEADAFTHRVRPVLQRHCGECHGADVQGLGLSLSSLKETRASSTAGAVVAPGNVKDSLLVQVLKEDSKPHMPPDGQLPADDVSVIVEWIDGLSANTPVGTSRLSAADRDHWSFQPIVRSDPPEVTQTDWAVTPIDQFVLRQLETAGIQPSPAADRATLLRRIYFGLIGLPPSPREVRAFLRDYRPDAYERIVVIHLLLA